MRLAVALAGVAFAVVLMFMQLGFQDALYRSALTIPLRLEADIVLVSPRYSYIASTGRVPRRRLYQALAVPGVRAVSPFYAENVEWKNPRTGLTRAMFAIGLDPVRRGMDFPDLESHWNEIRYPDVVFYDVRSRPEFGPVPAMMAAGEDVVTEVNRHHVTVKGLFQLGNSFGIDGTIVTSDLTFFRLFPGWPAGVLSLGLIQIEPGADVEAVRDALAATLAPDVQVLTRQQLFDRELGFWAATTPIGYVFTFGVVMGLIVGSIVVYQILFADISDHLPEYATLKAVGYTNRYLAAVVLSEALLLSVLGFLPGGAVCLWLYGLTSQATGLPMILTPGLAAMVLLLTAGMCMVSGLIALRKLRSADPAEVF